VKRQRRRRSRPNLCLCGLGGRSTVPRSGGRCRSDGGGTGHPKPKTFVYNAISAGVTTNAVTPALREFQIFDGQFKFNLDDVPLIDATGGSPHHRQPV